MRFTDAELLEKVVEDIDAHGHLQNSFMDMVSGKRCINGSAMVFEHNLETLSPFLVHVYCVSGFDMHNTMNRMTRILGTNSVKLNDTLPWSQLRDILLNKAKELRNEAT